MIQKRGLWQAFRNSAYTAPIPLEFHLQVGGFDPIIGAVYDAVMSGLGNRQRAVSGHGARTNPAITHPAPCAPSLCLFLLAGFRVERHGQGLPAAAWGRRAQAKTLVKLLALTPGHQLHREELLEWLWPEADFNSARNRFAKALYAARHALEPDLPPREESSYLHHRDDLLSLDLTRIWIDVDHFEQLAAAALTSDKVSDYEAALAAYGGPLLPADRYEDWAAARREALAARRLQMLLCLAETLERHGSLGPACERLRQAVALDPAGEKAHYRLMRLYALTGSRHQAIRQYHLCRAALEEEFGTVPEPATEELYQQLLAAKESVPESIEAGGGAVEILHAAPRLLPFPLVGRERVLEILLEALDAVGSGRGELLLVGGELGIGKTRLAAELAREAQDRGAAVLWGAGYAEEGVLPYGPFVEALGGYLRSRLGADREAWARLSPELRLLLHFDLADQELLPAGTNLGAERARLFAAVTQLLSEISAATPMLLVLDDLHAADDAGLQLLHHLARAAPEHSWLIVGTYREEEVSIASALGTLRTSLIRAGLCRRIDLGRFAQADCERFVASLLPDALDPVLLERLYARSLGNPLFLQELVRTMQEQEAIAFRDGAWRAVGIESAVPHQVQELVVSRVRGLGEAVYRTLSLAAVAGMECTFALLHAAGDYAEGPLLDALDRALEARVVDEQQDGYVFRHPLFRAALYEQLSARRRSTLHTQVARALEMQRPDEVEALAYHYARTDQRQKAILYLERAGDRALAVYANEAAADYYRDLPALLDSSGQQVEGAAAREKLGAVLGTLARYDEALQVLEHAAAAFRTLGDLNSVGRVAARIGRLQGIRGQPVIGSRYLECVLEELGPCASAPILAALSSSLALTYFAGGRYTAQLTAAERAARFARFADDPRVLAEAEGLRGLALLSLARLTEARQVLEEVIPLAEAAGDLFTLTGALNNLGAVYLRAGEFVRHVRCVEHALALAEEQGDLSGKAYFLGILGSSDFYRGDWQSARARLERAEALGRAYPSWVTPYPLLGLGELYLGQGDWGAAVRYLEECSSLAEGYGDVQCLREAGSLLVERELLLNRPEPAWQRLDNLFVLAEGAGADVTDLLSLRAWAYLALGNLQCAESAAVHSIRRARDVNNRFLLVSALRIQAMILTKERRWPEATHALAEGMALARQMPYPYAEARLVQLSGLLHVEQGEPVPAQSQLTNALAIFERLGSRFHTEQIMTTLATLST